MECYFPLWAKEIIIEIGKYMDGDHLKNYKLVCKRINNIITRKPEPMEITLENYQRTCKTSGHHFIKISDSKRGAKLAKSIREYKWPLVTHLLLDYCGIDYYKEANIQPLDYFRLFDPHSFKIIRYVNHLTLTIDLEHKRLSTLEIYTTSYILLYLSRKVRNIRLHSTRIEKLDSFSIIAIYASKELVEYAKSIPYYANSRAVFNSDRRLMAKSGPHQDFVPNQKFLSQ